MSPKIFFWRKCTPACGPKIFFGGNTPLYVGQKKLLEDLHPCKWFKKTFRRTYTPVSSSKKLFGGNTPLYVGYFFGGETYTGLYATPKNVLRVLPPVRE
jgi:hypothetical protein